MFSSTKASGPLGNDVRVRDGEEHKGTTMQLLDDGNHCFSYRLDKPCHVHVTAAKQCYISAHGLWSA